MGLIQRCNVEFSHEKFRNVPLHSSTVYAYCLDTVLFHKLVANLVVFQEIFTSVRPGSFSKICFHG